MKCIYINLTRVSKKLLEKKIRSLFPFALSFFILIKKYRRVENKFFFIILRYILLRSYELCRTLRTNGREYLTKIFKYLLDRTGVNLKKRIILISLLITQLSYPMLVLYKKPTCAAIPCRFCTTNSSQQIPLSQNTEKRLLKLIHKNIASNLQQKEWGEKLQAFYMQYPQEKVVIKKKIYSLANDEMIKIEGFMDVKVFKYSMNFPLNDTLSDMRYQALKKEKRINIIINAFRVALAPVCVMGGTVCFFIAGITGACVLSSLLHGWPGTLPFLGGCAATGTSSFLCAVLLNKAEHLWCEPIDNSVRMGVIDYTVDNNVRHLYSLTKE